MVRGCLRRPLRVLTWLRLTVLVGLVHAGAPSSGVDPRLVGEWTAGLDARAALRADRAVVSGLCCTARLPDGLRMS
ncbi:hypothetical protein [Streptomyces sp. 4N124]|uniref:hypothetical protein n=1 Tax=Streptomyces sp. 4N124 TaxID=3457420 RepID=UPI003FD4EB66